MVAKGHSARGRIQRRLTEEIVREIRVAKGAYSTLASRYSISIGTVNAIKNRHTWKHVA